MPVARSTGHAGKAVLVAAAGVIVAVVVAYLVATLASRGDVQLNFGEPILEAGRADRIAAAIDRQDGPVFYPPLVGDDRPVWIQHLGDDPQEGWLAFGAFEPDDPSCLVEWSADDQHFRSQCDPTLIFPPDGEGLRHYPVAVRDGRVRVDLQEITTGTTTTTTTVIITGD